MTQPTIAIATLTAAGASPKATSPTHPVPVTPGTAVVFSGSVTGYSASAAKTRPNDTTAYAAGDVVAESASAGTVWTFASIGPSAGRILITAASLRVDVSSVPSGMGAFRLHLYDASPTAINDNAAFDLPSGDRSKYLGFIELSTPEDLGATLWIEDTTVRKQVKLAASSTSLFGILETRAAFTPTAQAVKTINLSAIRLE